MSAPNHTMDKTWLQQAGQAIQDRLPDNHGFILLAMPFGSQPGARLFYVSSLQREDAICLLKEWLIKASGEEEWLKHLK